MAMTHLHFLLLLSFRYLKRIQERLGIVQSRERFPRPWTLIPRLSQADLDIIERCRLTSLLDMSRFTVNRGLLTALAERWHSDTNTFHFAAGEMTVTPEDCYRILRIPVVGAILPYEQTEEGSTEALRRILHDESVCGYEIPWQEFLDLDYAPLPSVLAGFIGGFLCLDRRSKRFSVGWGLVLEQMVTQGRRFAWGSAMLAHLFRSLHEVVYLGYGSLSAGVTLLQVWCWEHIPVARPLTDRDRPVGAAYAYGYRGLVVQRKLGKLEHWRRVFDDIDTVIWRPYTGCEVWAEDGIEMPFVFMTRYLIGRTPFVIERFVVTRVLRQFGRQQGIPQGACLYARRQQDVAAWGPTIDSVVAIEEFTGLAG
ncbi:protein MAINTENANCE OF MERISTEMS-like [Cryptomeria japonica]|uniref:protein MAINTENANCE OF MERISTEMS-like n=1 Tax=Cryptomeria japonica TaxID=3369 RepID=UPI0027DA7A42|nr:protein MAINTENANCE OF MERISTEMS-like [Cryptomeria japonica]